MAKKNKGPLSASEGWAAEAAKYVEDNKDIIESSEALGHYLPITGTYYGAKDAYDNIKAGNYKQAAIDAGIGLAATALPGLAGPLAKGVKNATKGFTKRKYNVPKSSARLPDNTTLVSSNPIAPYLNTQIPPLTTHFDKSRGLSVHTPSSITLSPADWLNTTSYEERVRQKFGEMWGGKQFAPDIPDNYTEEAKVLFDMFQLNPANRSNNFMAAVAPNSYGGSSLIYRPNINSPLLEHEAKHGIDIASSYDSTGLDFDVLPDAEKKEILHMVGLNRINVSGRRPIKDLYDADQVEGFGLERLESGNYSRNKWLEEGLADAYSVLRHDADTFMKKAPILSARFQEQVRKDKLLSDIFDTSGFNSGGYVDGPVVYSPEQTKELIHFIKEEELKANDEGGSVMADTNNPLTKSNDWWKNLENAVKNYTTYEVPGVGGEVSLKKDGVQYNRSGPLGSNFDFKVSPDNVGANLQWRFNEGGAANPADWANKVTHSLAQYNVGGPVTRTPMLPQVQEELLNGYNEGGKISINPENRGKFTAAAKARGLGVQEFANKVLSAPEGEYSPLLRKRANFARNFGGRK